LRGTSTLAHVTQPCILTPDPETLLRENGKNIVRDYSLELYKESVTLKFT